MKKPTHDLVQASKSLLTSFLPVEKDGALWLISDLPETDPGGSAIREVSKTLGIELKFVKIPKISANGQEPPPSIVSSIPSSDPVLAYTSLSLSSTSFRSRICSGGGRFFSLPGGAEALQLLDLKGSDLHIMRARGRRITKALEEAEVVEMHWSDAVLRVPIALRKPRLDIGDCRSSGTFGSPSFEVNIVPIEYSTEGKMKAMAAVPDIGIFEKPVTIQVIQGRVTAIKGIDDDPDMEKWNRFVTKSEPSMLRVGELGFGLNHLLHFPGKTYVESESIWRTAHIGIGRNLTLGGQFSAPGHIDIVLQPERISFDAIDFEDHLNEG